jgi:hypothetical protein
LLARVTVELASYGQEGAVEALRCFESFYPDVVVRPDGLSAVLVSQAMNAAQLRTALLAHLYEVQSRAARLQARDALLRELFL